MCSIATAGARPAVEYFNEANVSFDVQRSVQGVLTIIGNERSGAAFSATLFNSDFERCPRTGRGNFYLEKVDDYLNFTYKSFSINVFRDGGIVIPETQGAECQDRRELGKVGIRTTGTLENKGNNIFSSVTTWANAFHNFGTLQTAGPSQLYNNYLFNKGTVHLNNRLGADVLPRERGERCLNEPDFRNKEVGNFGTFKVGGKLLIDGGLYYVECEESQFGDLEMTGGDINVGNNGKMKVSGSLNGVIGEMVLKGELTAGNVNLTSPIENLWINYTGALHIKHSSEVTVDEKFDCQGELTSEENLTLRLKQLPKTFKGTVAANGSLRVQCNTPNKTLLVKKSRTAPSQRSEYLTLKQVGKIPDEWCWNDMRLVRIVVADGCRKIGSYAFYHCINLEEVVFSPSIEEIGEDAFWGCRKLKLRDWPANLKTVGNAMFGCTKITSIPEGVEEAGPCAFQHCEELVSLPKTLKKVGDSAFLNCKKLREWHPAYRVEVDVSAFCKCPNLVVTLKKQLFDTSVIAPRAFFGCKAVWVEDERGIKREYRSKDDESPLVPVSPPVPVE